MEDITIDIQDNYCSTNPRKEEAQYGPEKDSYI